MSWYELCLVGVMSSMLMMAVAHADQKNPKVKLTTTMGEVVIELDGEKAPITTENFVVYVKGKQYDGTIFHRVIPGFMIQGGGFDKDMKEKPTKAPIKNEAANGLKNTTGTIAMARTSDPNSATAQFFINVKDNASLDHKDNTPAGMGYAVFGKVVSGMEVVHKIEQVKTTTKSPYQNVPVEAVIITKAEIVE